MSCSEELVALLSRLGLERHVEQFEEEAITELSLLRSMGADMLRENLTELGMELEAIAALSAALFPEADEDEDADGLTLEDNEHGGAAERDAEAAAAAHRPARADRLAAAVDGAAPARAGPHGPGSKTVAPVFSWKKSLRGPGVRLCVERGRPDGWFVCGGRDGVHNKLKLLEFHLGARSQRSAAQARLEPRAEWRGKADPVRRDVLRGKKRMLEAHGLGV